MYGFISKSFVSNWYIFVALTIKKPFHCVKLLGYLLSAVNVVLFNLI